jgi:hypothetical protein
VYGIEIARAHPALEVVLMDLKEVAAEAAKYVERYGVGAQVSTAGVNMFTEAWPTDADAHFFSNVFHDWSDETNRDLAKRSFDALPSGGRIFLNEILMDDEYTGPYQAAAFSLLMLIGTLGKQYSLAEFRAILESAGFTDVEAQRTGGTTRSSAPESPERAATSSPQGRTAARSRPVAKRRNSGEDRARGCACGKQERPPPRPNREEGRSNLTPQRRQLLYFQVQNRCLR